VHTLETDQIRVQVGELYTLPDRVRNTCYDLKRKFGWYPAYAIPHVVTLAKP
jgi:hypothetical protein